MAHVVWDRVTRDDVVRAIQEYDRLGPEAWLNTARAELGLRQSGINPRDVMELQTENAARQ